MDAVSPFLVRHISPQWATAYGYVAGETAALLGMPLTSLPTLGHEARGVLSASMLFISSIAHIPHRIELVLKTARKDGAELSDRCVCFHHAVAKKKKKTFGHGGGDYIILESLRAPLRCGGATNPKYGEAPPIISQRGNAQAVVLFHRADDGRSPRCCGAAPSRCTAAT